MIMNNKYKLLYILALIHILMCITIVWLFYPTTTEIPQTLEYSEPEPSLPFHVTSSIYLLENIPHRNKECNKSDERKLKFRYLDVELMCLDVSSRRKACYVWYWDVANWTLTYTNKAMKINNTLMTILCPIPMHTFSSDTVYPARIIQRNGQVDYPGCSIKNEYCAPKKIFYAWYDNDLQLRINRSPCCRKLLTDITLHTGKVFDRHNITWFLEGGEVITVIRDNGEMIPYDTDSDIAVDVNDVKKIDRIMSELQSTGFVYRWVPELANGKELYMVGCTNAVHCLTGPGIAFYHVDGDFLKSVPTWHPLPANESLPPSRHNFMGAMMNFPRDPVRYLDKVYGKGNWETSRTCKTQYYGQCKT